MYPFLFLIICLFSQSGHTMIFENASKKPESIVDQQAQDFAVNFPAVCKIFLSELDESNVFIKPKSINGVLISVNKDKKIGYVLTSSQVLNKYIQNNCAIGVHFGPNGNLSEVPLESLAKVSMVYEYASHTDPTVPVLGIIAINLSDDFSIEPLPIYDGKGYLKGNLMDAAMVSYGEFSTGHTPIRDSQRRAGRIKVRFEIINEEHLLVFKGTNPSETFPTQLSRPAEQFELANNQAWPCYGDNGLPVLFKTTRGYQLAGIYDKMEGVKKHNVRTHRWYFIPRDIAWIKDVINDTLDLSKTKKTERRVLSSRIAAPLA